MGMNHANTGEMLKESIQKDFVLNDDTTMTRTARG